MKGKKRARKDAAYSSLSSLMIETTILPMQKTGVSMSNATEKSQGNISTDHIDQSTREKRKSPENIKTKERGMYINIIIILPIVPSVFFIYANLTFFFIPLFRFYTNASTKNEAIKTATSVIPIMANGKN